MLVRIFTTKWFARSARRERISGQSLAEAIDRAERGIIDARRLLMKQKTSSLVKAIIETADGLRRAGIMNDAAHSKITLRHMGRPTGAAEPISGEEIRQVREQARLSQAVFARCLNVTTGYVSQL